MTTPRPAFDLATAVSADGLAAHRAAVDHLVATARTAGVCRALVAIVADPSHPEIARMRALGRVLAELDHLAATPAPRRLVAA